MKKALFAILFCMNVGIALSQSNGNYRSRQSGDWNQATTWEVFNSGWHNLEDAGAGIYQNSTPTSARGIITISSGTVVRIPNSFSVTADQIQFGTAAPMASLIVDTGGTLTVNNGSGHDIRLFNDGTNFSVLEVSGTLRLNPSATIVNDNYAGSVVLSSHVTTTNTYKVLDGGVHIHYSNASLPYADWQNGSTLRFVATNKSPVIENVAIQFFNFIWDGTNQIGTGQSAHLNFEGRLRNVKGDFSAIGTNGRAVYLGSSQSYTLNIGGNLVIENASTVYVNTLGNAVINLGTQLAPGNFEISAGAISLNFSGNTTINVFGDYNQTGGIVNLRAGSSGGPGSTQLNLWGDFNQSGGSITRSTSGGSGNINFVGAGTTSMFNRTGGSIVNVVNYTVGNGKTLDLGPAPLVGAGSFTAFAGSTTILRSTHGNGAIQNSTSNGDIRVSGSRTFQTGSTLVYDGGDIQSMGPGHPAAANTRIENIVYMVSNVTINGALSTGDALIIDGNTLTLGGNYIRDTGFLGITPASNLIINGSGAIPDLHLAPVLAQNPDNPMNNLTINRAGTVTLTRDLIVGGTFTLSNGTLLIGQQVAYNLTLQGNVVRTNGSLAIVNNPNLTISGSGILPLNLPIAFQTPSSYIGQLTMNRPAAIFSTNSAVSCDTINLFNGTINNINSNLTMRSDGLVVRRDEGSINQVLTAVDSYDVHYQVTGNISSGNELPDLVTALDSLVKQGAGTVTLAKDITVNGSLSIQAGVFNAGLDNEIAIQGNLLVDGLFEPQEGRVIFSGADDQSVVGSALVPFYDIEVNQEDDDLSFTIGTEVNIINSLAVNSESTLEAGNEMLTLLSTPLRTANVNQLPDGASILGSVIVQRYLPKVVARRSFYYMASPVTNSNIPDWDLELPINKVYRWNEPTRKYAGVPLASAILPGRGFAVDVASPATFTYDTRGTLQTGDIGVPVTAQSPLINSPDGWNLIGNPYPSAISWNNIARPTGIYNAMYITDNYGNSGQGPEVERRVSYIDGVGVPASYTGTIAQGQAFWVKATANTTLTFTEAAKITATDVSFFREGEVQNVLRIFINGMDIQDEAVVRLRDGSTDRFDERYDAFKFLKGDLSLSTLTSDKVQAVINSFGPAACSNAIPIVVEGVKQGATYTFNFTGLESFDKVVTISLLDQQEKKTFNIQDQPSYTFTVTDTTAFPSRFQLSIQSNTTSINASLAAIGSDICVDESSAIVTVQSTEPGVEYRVMWGGNEISTPVLGTGTSINLLVDASKLPVGENRVDILASRGTCSLVELNNKPVVNKVPKSEILSVRDGVVCTGGTALLTVLGSSPRSSFNWYESENALNPVGEHSSNFRTPDLKKSKTYYVSEVNELGCEGSRVPVRAIVSQYEDVSIKVEGSSLISSVKDGNQWFLNDKPIEGAISNSIFATEAGVYSVKVGTGECFSQAQIEIGLLNENALSVYPNPTEDRLYVQLQSANENVVASIVNSQGQKFLSKSLAGRSEIKEAEFDLMPLSSGMYYLHILDGPKIIIRKIIKLK